MPCAINTPRGRPHLFQTALLEAFWRARGVSVSRAETELDKLGRRALLALVACVTLGEVLILTEVVPSALPDADGHVHRFFLDGLPWSDRLEVSLKLFLHKDAEKLSWSFLSRLDALGKGALCEAVPDWNFHPGSAEHRRSLAGFLIISRGC